MSSSLSKTFVVSLTNFLGAGAIVASAGGLTLWQNYLGLNENDLSTLNALSANCLGAAIGAFIGGFLSDKYGRKFIFTYNTLLYIAGVALIGTAATFGQLLTGILIAGISVGASVPASWTYISEISEPQHRGRNIAISQAAWGFGPFVILLLNWLLAPGGQCFDFTISFAKMFNVYANHTNDLNVYASRIAFFALGVVAFITWMLGRRLDESQVWLDRKDKAKTEPKFMSAFATWDHIIRNKKYMSGIIFLVLVYLSWNLVSSVMGFFQNQIYETAGSLSNMMASLFNTCSWGFTVLFTFIAAFFVDHAKHRTFFIFSIANAIAAWVLILFIGIDSFAALIVFTALWSIQAGISVQFFYALWSTEFFPTRHRAAVLGITFCVVRALSAVWSFCFTGIYGANGEGFTACGWLMFILLVACAAIGIKMMPNTRGKSLEEIQKERYGDQF